MGKVLVFPAVRDYWREKKILPSRVFNALVDFEKAKAGSLTGVWNTKFIEEIYGSLTDAFRGGQTLRDWLPRAQAILDGFGGDPGTRIYSGDTWSSWYADLVFRTNTAEAYAAGRYSEMFNPEWLDKEPYWLYSGILDGRIRPEHQALDGRVFAKDDAEGRRFLPPWDYGCRCTAIPLTQADVDAGGYDIAPGHSVTFSPPEGWNVDRLSIVPDPLREETAA